MTQLHKKTCDRCGESVESPHVHHKDRNRKNNIKINLETLCSECHGKEHGCEGHEASGTRYNLLFEMSKGREGFRLTEGFRKMKSSEVNE